MTEAPQQLTLLDRKAREPMPDDAVLAEREACARVVEDAAKRWLRGRKTTAARRLVADALAYTAAEIRGRG